MPDYEEQTSIETEGKHVLMKTILIVTTPHA